jgi:hypothetical protein
MKKKIAVLALALASALPLAAQDWSIGAATGPFVFGNFVERTVRIGTGDGPSGTTTLVLSAGTRAGGSLDIERSLGDRWAIRLEGTFTNAPLRLDQSGAGGDGAELDAGDLDVATFMLPLVFRINPKGALRFHVLAGPALAIYKGNAPDTAGSPQAAFDGTQKEWGVAFGGGAGWWLSDRFAIEGNLTDTITTSPFDEESFPSAGSLEISRPHNVHTTIGVRWRF